MKYKNIGFFLSLFCAAFISGINTARAGDIVFYGGIFNVSEHKGIPRDGVFGVEYRVDDVKWGLRPTVGASVDLSGDIYGYGGLNLDLKLTDTITFTPNFMVGLYHHGNGEDLGGPIEFKSGLELSYSFPNKHRLGVAVSHMSNAHIYDRSPGEESVLVVYSIPLR